MATAKQGRRGGKGKAPAYHHGALRESLLAAAEALLAEEGVEGFTLRECARRAGVSHAAPAHHFRDVNALFTALAARGFERLTGLMRERRAEAKDAFGELRATGLGYVEFAGRHPALFALMFRGGRLDATDPAFQEHAGAAFGELETAMKAVAPAAGQGSPEVLFAWALVHGFAALQLEGRLAGFGVGSGASPAALAWAGRLLDLSRPAYSPEAPRPRRR